MITPASDKPLLAPPRAAAVVCASEQPGRWQECLLSINAQADLERILVIAPADEVLVLPGRCERATDSTLAAAVSRLMAEGFDLVLVAIAPVVLPPDALREGRARYAADSRTGTMSFLSNTAGYLSFPNRNSETPVAPPGHDERTVTARLRGFDRGSRTIPIPVFDGGAVLIGRGAVEFAGGLLTDPTLTDQALLAELSLRFVRRGFHNLLDLTTYVLNPWDTIGHHASALSLPVSRHKLNGMHGFFPGLHDHERDAPSSLLGQALDLARAKLNGLRVLIDGSELGEQQMGTQMLILCLSIALARSPGVSVVHVAVPNPRNLPAYTRALLQEPKVRITAAGRLDFPDAPEVDIIHRPFQPTGSIPWERWRQIAKRCVITVQDLIAFRNGAYFRSWPAWRDYRRGFIRDVRSADGIIAISHDVVETIHDEHLPIAASRLFMISNGIDHMEATVVDRTPDRLIDKGWVGRPFALVLGTNYAHKNRDVAIRIWRRLRARGQTLVLVMVGAHVPFGSSRIDEASHRGDEDGILILPDVAEMERNWLLKHAALAIYPTSAEGFGLIPFEVAQMGVPCLYVAFGPLAENTEDAAAPRGFDLTAIVDYGERLLTDPAARKDNVSAILQTRDRLTWAHTARGCVDCYFDLMADFGLVDHTYEE
jgi:glycosyltransferase involved in cell wall biosynthesis